MKLSNTLLITLLLALASCNKYSDMYDEYVAEQETTATNTNAESIFGKIDPNQDWSGTTASTVSVAVEASYPVAKVQILTESPFNNAEARVLAEADATNGQTVSIAYEAPKINRRLIAACVSSEGRYTVKGFDVGQSQVTFTAAAASRATMHRAADAYPEASKLKIEYSQSEPSYNALKEPLKELLKELPIQFDAAANHGLALKQTAEALTGTGCESVVQLGIARDAPDGPRQGFTTLRRHHQPRLAVGIDPGYAALGNVAAHHGLAARHGLNLHDGEGLGLLDAAQAVDVASPVIGWQVFVRDVAQQLHTLLQSEPDDLPLQVVVKCA